MKEFEKYWDYTGLSEHVNYHPDPEGPECIRVSGINRKEERREGWKEALEKVLEKKGLSGKSTEDIIREELEQ